MPSLFDFWDEAATRELAALLIANQGTSEVPTLAQSGFSRLAFFNGFRLGFQLAGGNAHQLAALDTKVQAAIVLLQSGQVAIPDPEQVRELGKPR